MSNEGQSVETMSENVPTLVDINHDTGDLVLSIRKDGHVVEADAEFRVHRALITLHSSVFRDLVASADPNEYVDGCPVIPCYGDSAEDFRALLTALYNGLAILQEKLALDVALAIFRLSHKYQMEGLYRGVTRILLENWPLNYHDYKARRNYLDYQGFRVLESMKLIKTAQQCEAWELLPAAFNEVAATRQQDWTDIELSACMEYLTQQDLSRMWKGRERAINRLASMVQWAKGTPPLVWNLDNSFGPTTLLHLRGKMGLSNCTGRALPIHFDGIPYCRTIPYTLFNTICVQLLQGKTPLDTLMNLQRSDVAADGLCSGCLDWVFNCILDNKTMELWHNFPLDCELPMVDPKLYSERTLPHFFVL